jgi:hypothetical protein
MSQVAVANTGSVVVQQGGGLSLGGSGSRPSSGSFTGAAGTTLVISGQDLTSTSVISSAGSVRLSGCTEAGSYSVAGDTSAGSVTFTGPVQLGTSLEVGDATFAPAVGGPVTLTTGALTVGQGGLHGTDSFVANGLLTLGRASDLSVPVVDAYGGLTIDGTTGYVPTIQGTILNNHASATVQTGYGYTLYLYQDATINNLANASFTITGPGGSVLDQDNSAVAFNNAGTLTCEGTASFVMSQVAVANTGSVVVQQGGGLSLGNATNSGTVMIASGGALRVGTYSQAAGLTVLNGATISGGSLSIAGGSLTGSGTINASVGNGGQVIPGGIGAIGMLTINGNYTQTATGSLDIELGGTAAGASDLLAVTGTASLGGTLNIATLGSFAPAFANTFQVMTFGSSAGNFNTYGGTSLASGLFLDPVFSASSLTLAVDRVAIGGAPPFPLQGNPINLTASVTGPSAGNSFTFSWNVTQNGNPFGSGSGAAFTFTPNLNATYLVTLTVTDVIGGKGIVTQSIVVDPSIFVLNPTASGALTLSGNASINIPGEVIVDSSSPTALTASGNAQLNATVVDMRGGFQKTGNATISPAPSTGVSINDPLASLGGPGASGTPVPINFSKGTQSISQGVYSQISVSGNASLTLGPGIYVIEGGGLTVTGNASISGQNVFIYNAGSNYPGNGGNFGGITLSGNGTFNLTSPTAGTYAGILIFQSRQNTRALSLSGNAMAGMSGLIYAPNALLSMSGNAALTSALDVGMLNLSGNVALTQTATGSDGSGDTSGVANTLLAGNLTVYINDPTGLFTADELARIQDAVNAWNAILAPYNVAITDVSDPTLANIAIDTRSTSACGGAASGVLGCYNAPNGEITLIEGWNWYAGADASKIGTSQYDFETTVLHELGHALGLGGATNPSSPMYETLASGAALRTVTTQDLNIPDPPAGADPQMAAGFGPDSSQPALSPRGFAAALGSGPSLSRVALMSLPRTPAVPASLLTGFWTQKSSRTVVNSVAIPEPSMVLQGADPDSEFCRALAEPRIGPVLDWALYEPAADPDCLPVENGSEAIGASAQPRPEEAEAHTGLDDILFQDAWRTPASKFLMPLDTGLYPVFVIPSGRMPAPQTDSTRERASWLSRLAVILLAAGPCGYGARGWIAGNQRPRCLRLPAALATAKNMNRRV